MKYNTIKPEIQFIKGAEVPTNILNASIHSFHHILCHSTKSSLIYACSGL
jgi:hypothetical protein